MRGAKRFLHSTREDGCVPLKGAHSVVPEFVMRRNVQVNVHLSEQVAFFLPRYFSLCAANMTGGPVHVWIC